MFSKRVTLFHFFGFKVNADSSWIFLAILIGWTLSGTVYPALYPGQSMNIYQFMSLATLAGIFISIIAHEVAHAIIAEHYQMPIESITLFIFGGVAEMKGDPSHPKGEFLMAVAGPAMSLLMGLFFLAASEVYTMHIRQDAAAEVLRYLGNINILIAILNMVPAFPLDGGRALRAAIWYLKNNLVLATRIASKLGAAFAYGLLGSACYMLVIQDDFISGLWLGLLGLFLHATGAYAVWHTESRSLLAQEKVSRFMHTQIITVSPDLTITDFVDNYIYRHYQKLFPVLDHAQQLIGIITLQSVLSLERHKWQWLHVASVMNPLTSEDIVSPATGAAEALDIMQKHRKESLIVAHDRRFVGVINYHDLASYLAVSMRIDDNRPVINSR